MFVKRRYAKKRVYRKRKAQGKKPTIAGLAKAVKGLMRREKVADEYLNLGQYNVADSLTAPFYQVNLCNYGGMAPIFGSDADDDNDNKIIHKSFGMDLRVSLENTINNEENTIGFTTFLVSLRDAATPAFNPTTGVLTLTANTHYYQTTGMTLLNKKFFKIHKIKRFTLTNYGTALTASAAQSQYGSDCRWYWKMSPSALIQNPIGNWSALASALDPSKQYYLLVFNDNTSADGESPALTTNIVHTMKKCK